MHIVLDIACTFFLSMTVGGLVGGANIIDQLFGNVNPQTTIVELMVKIFLQINLIILLINNKIFESWTKINNFHLQRARNTAWNNLMQDILVSQEVELV